MIKAIAGVFLGYVVMALLVFLLFSSSYLALGADRAFLPGSYWVSTTWIVVSLVVHLVAALAGGYVAAAVSRGRGAALALACLVLIFGILFGIIALGQPDPGPRAGDVGNFAAMQSARQPTWIMFLSPIVGAAGVLVGSRLKKVTGKP